ncbi:hypothetical protein J2T56_003006 [Natronobacillus azotifigens]|uniref:Uncharacterized protein n=1 Tax=Natronobacillus azotifigens TaxID=472978 RepID=A0A9J6RGF0_9BACI|nr:hypothetical protein [Natronobacillus azotifigens]MCZ0704484.1 hypothetical protein [Natronobacillus azotifigens]
MAKKKNKSNTPRRKRMKRSSRLQAAKHWIPKYNGKNLVSGYSNYFAVDKLCAVKELEMLGHTFSDKYKQELKDNMIRRQVNKERRRTEHRKRELEMDLFEESDETFAFIAGYTSGGASYGITWEEWGDIEKGEEDLESSFEEDEVEGENGVNVVRDEEKNNVQIKEGAFSNNQKSVIEIEEDDLPF